uniref:Uncharacterized protein n=1 Tax=Chenopodium quinoa TaxID=63459 RepID=A0A803KYH3_CHEQI
MAKEVLKTHDAVLCDRPKLLMPQVVFYKSTDIALAPYGEYWRQVRKIATLELFTARRVQGFRCFREDAVLDFVKLLLAEADAAGSVINLTSKIFALSFDITLRLAVNKKADDGEEFRKLVADMAALLSGFSIGDLYPSIEFISVVSGMKRKLKDIVRRVDNIMDPIIEEHLCNKRLGQNEGDEDIVDILLQFHNDDLKRRTNDQFSLTTDNIKAIIIEVFGAGGETSSTTIDWAMSELLKNPRVMKKAQNEVRRVFQGKEIMIDEASLDRLVYLKHVIKETLRLHPPVPFLVPRESMERCEINGYEIPPNTRIFVNAWAIERDPEYWQDPEVLVLKDLKIHR